MPPKKAAKRTKGTSKEEKGSASAAEPSVMKRRKVAEEGVHYLMHAAYDDHVI